MMQATVRQTADWVGALEIVGDTAVGEEQLLSGVSTDTRSIRPGQLFVPLRGERFDGHDYIITASEAGAAAALWDAAVPQPEGLDLPLILVPDTLEALDLSGALCGFEVFIDAIPEPKAKATRTKPALDLSALQAVKRDFAFVVDRTVEAGAILKAAASADRKLIVAVNVFDVFEGASLGADKKSVAIEVVIQPVEKTLTDEDFDALTAKIVGNVTKTTGGTLRA